MTTLPDDGRLVRASTFAPSPAARPSRLMAGIYHEIGLAAVAAVLDMPVDDLEGDLANAVRRGARYIYLMPRRK